MRKSLLIAATLGAFALSAAPARAGDHAWRQPQPTSSFGLGTLVWPAPTTVHRYRPHPWQLRPQPVPRFAHPLPRPIWQHWPRPQLRHFEWWHHGHPGWRGGGHGWRDGGHGWRDGGHGWRDGGHGWHDGGHGWRDGGHGWHDGGHGWRDGGDGRRSGDTQWRHRAGRDHAGHDRRRR